MSFLKIIEKYIKENNIILPYIPIDKKAIPFDLRYTIIEIFKKKSCSLIDTSKLEYFIEFDSNGYAYLSVSDGETSLLILDGDKEYDNYSMIGARVSEATVFKKLAKRDYNKYLNEIKNIDKRFIKPYNEVENIANICMESAEKFCSYIGYLNKEYLESKAIEEQFIVYDEPNAVETIHNGETCGMTISSRKYPILSVEERFLFLEGQHPSAICNCISNRSSKIAYKSYGYDLDNGLSCLIAEPISGTSFIKVSYYDEEINEENIGELSKQLLQMDIKEIHDNPKTLHAKHTTFETFKNLILSCLGEDRTLNYYTKSNIVRSISGLKKEDK